LPGARGGPGAAAVHDHIYVIGGFDTDDIATGAVDVYDPRADAWRHAAPMPTARGLLKVARVGGLLYAIGGRDDDNTSLAAVERYDPRRNQWHAVAPLNEARGNPAVAVVDDAIVVVGGAGAGEALRTTEVYDVRADRWRTLDALLPVGRASFSGARLDRHGHRDAVLTFGGFEVTGGGPVATAEAQSLSVGRPPPPPPPH
jgi:N-acetylneuraminic acid mutarotase